MKEPHFLSMPRLLLIPALATIVAVGLTQSVNSQQDGTSKTTAAPVQEADGDGAPKSPRRQLVDESAPVLKEVPKVTDERPRDFWMQHKLDHSKKMLEAMTLADYEQVRFGAQQMRLLGRIEGFVRRANPAYTAQAKAFDNSLTALMQGAKKKDSMKVNAAFNKMTTSCVRCHSVLSGEAK